MVFPVICNSFNVPAALALATVLIAKTAAGAGRLAQLEWVKRRLEGKSNHRLPVVADGVDSPHLPACGFPAPGDPRLIASC